MKIALIKLSALGDIVHAMVVLQFIKRQYPHYIIDWIVEERFKAILENNPDINEIKTINLTQVKEKKSLLALIKELRKVRKFSAYDLVIDAQGLIKSAIIGKILDAKVFCGFDKKSIREKLASYFYQHKVTIAYDKNIINRNIAVICNPLNIKVTNNDILDKNPFLFYVDYFLIPKQEYVIFIVNSTWKSKNYPQEKFVEIAKILQMKCLVAWNTEKERDKANRMSSQSKYIDVLPKLNLNDLKSVISHAKLLIGNDTGPTHMAWALNIPSITIFGPTPTSRVYQTPINKIVKSNPIVNPYKLNKNDYSIGKIPSRRIIKIAQKLLASQN